ncbi:MAG: hypothetical protein IT431_13060 [Phycisphaerales bacterium]|nr:hypothetical protein [Phycisphaerales bacterium]
MWQTCPPRAVSAAPDCPTGGFNEHRLAERAVVLDLLGAAPGSVPQWAFLAVGAAPGRSEHRAIGEALARLAAAGADYGRLAAREAQVRCERVHTERVPDRSAPAPERAVVPGYEIARRKWPVGGLIDLVV